MPKISTMFWFDSQAEEAAKFYESLFEHSKLGQRAFYGKAGFEFHRQPEGKLMTIEFELEGQRFVGLNGGPVFKFTPSISFLIACGSKKEVEAFWEPLSAGGEVMMELGEYPFSPWYGWTKDRFGLSWQVMQMGDIPSAQKITPTLMYVGHVAGKAEEAIRFYASIFSRSKVGDILRYAKGEEPDREGTIKHAGFTLEGREFAAMDSAYEHGFSFTEAISFVVSCDTQKEIDHFWKMLTEGGDPNAQQCGWLKDKYDVSWQVTPAVLETMLADPDRKKVERVTNAYLKMKKFDIGELEKAYGR